MFQNTSKKRDSNRANLESSESSPASKYPRLGGTGGSTGAVAGAGMVHPVVLSNGGYDPEEWTGFAFGMGVERPALLKHNIDDIRYFYNNDLRFLHQF